VATGRVSFDVGFVATLTWVISKVERGVANKGEEVEVVGLGQTFKTTLTGIGTWLSPSWKMYREELFSRDVSQGTGPGEFRVLR
jgi:translation elongation factor EF-Tu-like GTPase